MKSAILLVLVAASLAVAEDVVVPPVSMDTGFSQSNVVFEDFVKATYNSKSGRPFFKCFFKPFFFFLPASCSPCGCSGCCPVIVENCAPKWVGTVVEAYGEWMANAAVIVDWGCTEYNPCGCECKRGRLCTTEDTGFT